MENETKNVNNKTKATEKSKKRNLLQRAGDKWAEMTTGKKIFSGVAAGLAATAAGFGIKALIDSRRDDDEDDEDDNDDDYL